MARVVFIKKVAITCNYKKWKVIGTIITFYNCNYNKNLTFFDYLYRKVVFICIVLYC